MGAVVAVVLLAAVKVPAIPVQYQETQSYQVEDARQESVATATPAGGPQASGSEGGGGDSPGVIGITANKMTDGSEGGGGEADNETVAVPLEYEIVSAEAAATGLFGNGVETRIRLRNTDNVSGEFVVVLRYRGPETERRATIRETVAPNETVAFVNRTELRGSLRTYEIEFRVRAPNRTVTVDPDETRVETERERKTVTVTKRERVTLLDYLLGRAG